MQKQNFIPDSIKGVEHLLRKKYLDVTCISKMENLPITINVLFYGSAIANRLDNNELLGAARHHVATL